MNSRKFRLIILAILLVTALFWFWLHRKPQTPPVATLTPSQTPAATSKPTIAPSVAPNAPTLLPQAAMQQAIVQEREREKKQWDLWLATPISFYGKVVDEKNNPVADAKILLSFVDTAGPGEGHTKVNLSSDSSGLFQAKGHGLAVVAMVTKDGYYHLDKSDGTFGYSKAAGRIDPHSDPNDPAVFVLRKQGKIEQLIVKSIGGSLAKNGTLTEINFQSGRRVTAGQGDLVIQCWTNDQGLGPRSSAAFDWRCQIAVNGGGLIEKNGGFDFEAPEQGYLPSTEIDMPTSSGNDWRNNITKEYFVQTASGNYARVRFMMNAGGEQTYALTIYYNPQPGSRNLEYGPPAPGESP